jgi:LCP family protein required for cell wall assembly
VAAALVVAVTADGIALWRRPSRVSATLPGSAPGGSTVLLIGTDARSTDQGGGDDLRYGSEAANPGERADVVLALRTDDDGTVRLLEIPRDLLVVGEKGAPVRLTTTLLDGPSGTTEALCRSLGLGVDHVVEVRFPGLRSIVDSVGGIEVTLDRSIRDTYTRFQLDAGTHLLNGDDVLAYVAARKLEVLQPDGTWKADTAAAGDRSSKGADVLRELGRRIDPSPLHPVAAQHLAWAVTGALAVDDRLSPTDAPGLWSSLRALPSVDTTHLPTTPPTTGVVPITRLEPGAGAVLAEFEGSDTPAAGCRPVLPNAVRP